MESNDLNAERITDLSYLVSVCGDDPEFKKELIETFLKETPPMIDDIKGHLIDSEWKKIGDIAHKMKPSFTFMGIHSAKELILDLERNGKQEEDTPEISGLVLKLDNICSKAFAELNNELNNL